MASSDLETLRTDFARRLPAGHESWFAPAVIRSWIAQLDACEHAHDYQHIPEPMRSASANITARHGLATLDLCNRMLLLTLVSEFESRRAGRAIPASIAALVTREHERIVNAIVKTESTFFEPGNELFIKDLGLCRLKLLPCGAEVVDVWAGVPRITLFRGGFGQFLRAALLFGVRLHGFRPVYESHWDRRFARDFSAAAYDQCYLRIAELLRVNPQIKAMVGASWWFDPQLEQHSPEFLFLRRTPQENGAQLFDMGSDAGAVRDATTFSKKRKTLFEAGKFKPSRYMLVWPRGALLAWADRFARGGVQ